MLLPRQYDIQPSLRLNANHDNKFDKEFDWYYDRAISEYDLKAYYIGADSMNYFLMTRKARSINPMREGNSRWQDQVR